MKQAKTTAAAIIAIAIAFVAGTAAETAEQRAMREAEAAAAEAAAWQAKADAEWAAYEAEQAEKAAKEKEASAKAAAKLEAAPPTAAQAAAAKEPPPPPLKDPRDGKTYKTIKIAVKPQASPKGGKVASTVKIATWMAENLNYDASGSKCYEDKPENCGKYGRLYDWEAAMKACPSGWHLPSNAEWDGLYSYVDGESYSKSPYESKAAGRFLKAASGWKNGLNGTDKYGFAALPGGVYSSDAVNASKAGSEGNWWTSSASTDLAYLRTMSYDSDIAGWETELKFLELSVRCVKD